MPNEKDILVLVLAGHWLAEVQRYHKWSSVYRYLSQHPDMPVYVMWWTAEGWKWQAMECVKGSTGGERYAYGLQRHVVDWPIAFDPKCRVYIPRPKSQGVQPSATESEAQDETAP